MCGRQVPQIPPAEVAGSSSQPVDVREIEAILCSPPLEDPEAPLAVALMPSSPSGSA